METINKISKQKKIGYAMAVGGLATIAYGYSKRKNTASNAGAIGLLGLVLIALAINQISYS